MDDPTISLLSATADCPIPLPRRRRPAPALGLHAVEVITRLGLLPLVASVVGLALFSYRQLQAGPRGRPLVHSDASILLLALLGRLWHLSTREVCLWLGRWPALAAACGLPPGRVIHPAHLARRVRCLGAYPFWRLYLALVWRAIRVGLFRGRDVVLDSTLLAACTTRTPPGRTPPPPRAASSATQSTSCSIESPGCRSASCSRPPTATTCPSPTRCSRCCGSPVSCWRCRSAWSALTGPPGAWPWSAGS